MEEYNKKLEARTNEIKKLLGKDKTKTQKIAALEKLYEQYKEDNPELEELSLLKYKKFPSKF